jgi:trehalose-6-phosphatase
LAAEHGFFFRRAGSLEWDTRSSVEEMTWRSIVGPILQQYTESTDGTYVEKKESAFVWHYAAADPDFGSLQVHSACEVSCGMARSALAAFTCCQPSVTDIEGSEQGRPAEAS